MIESEPTPCFVYSGEYELVRIFR